MENNFELTGFTLNFNGSAIPKKPRGSIGSKSHVASGPSGSVHQTNQMTSDSKCGGVDMPSIPQIAKKKTRQRYNHKEKINRRKRCRFDDVTNAERPLRFGADDIPSIHQHAKKKRKQLNIDKESSVNRAANVNSNRNLNRSGGLTGSALSEDGVRTPREPRRKNCNLGVQSIPQHGKKRRGRFANSTDDEDVGDASSRKGQSHGKKMKCLPVDNLEFAEEAQPVVEYVKSSSEYSFDDNVVVNALMLLSTQSDAQCTGPSRDVSRRKNFKDFIPVGLTKSGKENGRQAPKSTVKHGMLPFSLTYSAAPLFFRSLHLKLLMRSTLACVRLRECTLACAMGLRASTCNSTTICQKRISGDTKGSQRNLELLACNSNVLITLRDRCWRKSGMRVVLEFPDQNEWSLAVKFSGSTEYLHKVHHVFKTVSANRYTRAMMWKGGKDWALEFPDRSQWMLFKEMHAECYKRNICAASVKAIPTPGVRLVEKCQDNPENPFTRSSGYLRKVENDIDMAMNPLKILYDMDSEDEQWILRNEKSFQTQTTSCRVITDDIFEKTMDVLEKFAYAQQRDHFTVAEIEKFIAGVVPTEVIDSIYQHWQQKRKRIGRPLIRHLQPPSWETYERKLQEWHQIMTQVNDTAACGGNMKTPPVEKPAMFAFCLKPHVLEVPHKRLKRRSKKKVHLGHALIGDQDGIYTLEKRSNPFTFRDEKATFPDCSSRLFSLNNDASDFYNHPRLFKNKSKEITSQLGMQALDEFSVRDLSCAAKDACKIARIKRERAERLFFKAENAIHVAHSALMTVNAVKAAPFRSD